MVMVIVPSVHIYLAVSIIHVISSAESPAVPKNSVLMLKNILCLFVAGNV